VVVSPCALFRLLLTHAGGAQVFEKLGDNLLTLIKRYDYRGVPLDYVRSITQQMLVGLDYLHRERQIIHTDLKPENVLLEHALPDAMRRRRSSVALSGGKGGKASAPGGGAAAGASGALTKNQKKKLKRKAKKGGGADGGAGGSEATGGASESGPGADEPSAAGDEDGPVEAPEADAADSGAATEPAADVAAAAPDASAPPNTDAAALCEAPATDAAAASPPPAEGDDAAAAPADVSALPFSLDCKIVDLGNACWTYKQFTNDIQTRQYRCPEVLLGAPYGTAADMWSLACIVFELVTGDLLFDPRSGEDYERDEDHLALMIELVGRIPRKVALGGKYSRDYFTKTGELKHIRRLRMWPLDRVLQDKYRLDGDEARSLADFLTPMLQFVPETRATAAACLLHPWLRGGAAGGAGGAPPQGEQGVAATADAGGDQAAPVTPEEDGEGEAAPPEAEAPPDTAPEAGEANATAAEEE